MYGLLQLLILQLLILQLLILPDSYLHHRRAKYELSQAVRTQMAGSEAAYGCVYQTEDPDGVVGVRLSKELMAVAGEALKVSSNDNTSRCS